jgi:undecaprenyl-diphosphatase
VGPIFSSIVDLLPIYGPWLLFGLAILETSFVTGLAIPSGLATSAATALAVQGDEPLAPFVVAALGGGAIGDSLGFWVGRAWGEHVLRSGGVWSRALRQRQDVIEHLFERHPLYSVTVARLVSFVRTVMPMAAGMSDLTYRRFLPYEIAGLVGWATIYVGLGLLAGESLETAGRLFGWGGALVFTVVGAMAWRAVRKRRSRASSSRKRAP